MNSRANRFGTLCGVLSVISIIGVAEADDPVVYEWIGARDGTYHSWSDAANWSPSLPPNDGTADIRIVNDQTGGSSTHIYVDQPWSINSLTIKQGSSTFAVTDFLASSKTLTIGAGGFRTENFLATYASTTIKGYADGFAGPISFAASQSWYFMHDGAGNVGQGSLYHQISGDWSSAADVELELSGKSGKYRFTGGSATNFLGTVNVKIPLLFSGAETFSHCGTSRLILSAAQATDGRNPDLSLFFEQTASGVGYVDTPIHFDCLEKGKTTTNIRPSISAAYHDGEIESKTVFRAPWTGIVRGYDRGLTINAPADGYGAGDWVHASYANGTIRPETYMFVFDNDMSGLVVTNRYVKEDGTVEGPSTIYGTLPMLMFNRQSAVPGNGHKLCFNSDVHPGHIRGILLGDNVYYNQGNENSVISHIEPTVKSHLEAGITVFGAGAPGTCGFGTINLQKCTNQSGYGMEQALWFYAVPGSEVTFMGTMVRNGSGSGRYLPMMVKGGGDVVLNNSFGLGVSEAPYWVRSGRLRIKKTSAIDRTTLRLGAPVRDLITVRAIYMRRMSGVASGGHDDNSKIVFSTMPKADGVTLTTGDRVLVNIPDVDYSGANSPRESRKAYNGIYEVNAETKTWTRIAELDNYEEDCQPELAVKVLEGSRFAGTRWFLHNSHYYIKQRLGLETMPGGFWALTFHEENVPDNDIALLNDAAITITNRVIVSENRSAGRSVFGGNGAVENAWSGEKRFEKDVTLTASSEGRCTLSATHGLTYGTNAVAKIGLGEVVIDAACAGADAENPTFVITNVTVAAGRLTLAPSLLKDGLRTVGFDWASGSAAELNLDGDADLSDWTIEVKGVPSGSFAKGAEPEDFEFGILSTGSLTGTPTITGVPGSRWVLTSQIPGRYTLSYVRPGAMLIVR